MKKRREKEREREEMGREGIEEIKEEIAKSEKRQKS